jgi:SOS-response transcriptional repressor LexA/DNA-binding XRE family transcriptional regulator
MDNKEFGVYFSNLRKKSGFKSQRQLATVSGVNNATIARIEDGSQKAKPETLKILSRFLSGISYGNLMEKAGYLDNYSFNEKEDLLAKYDFMDITESLAENFIQRLSINDDLLPDIKNELSIIFKEYNMGGINLDTPKDLLNLYKNSTDLDFKLRLYEALFKIYNSYSVEYKLSGSSPIDEPNKETPPIKVNEDLYSLIHYINNEIYVNKSYEIVDKDLLNGKSGFALKVIDDSMKDEGIFKEDSVICVKDEILSQSDICVVLSDNNDILLRKVKYYDEFCMLIPANSAMAPEIVDLKSVRVIGKVIQSRRNFN